MPRRARVALPHVPLHLIQRGNNRQACFFADEDYRFYLDWLAVHAGKTGCRIHAYALMTNHVHILLTAERAEGPGALMKALGQRYVQYVQQQGTDHGFHAKLNNPDFNSLLCPAAPVWPCPMFRCI